MSPGSPWIYPLGWPVSVEATIPLTSVHGSGAGSGVPNGRGVRGQAPWLVGLARGVSIAPGPFPGQTQPLLTPAPSKPYKRPDRRRIGKLAQATTVSPCQPTRQGLTTAIGPIIRGIPRHRTVSRRGLHLSATNRLLHVKFLRRPLCHHDVQEATRSIGPPPRLGRTGRRRQRGRGKPWTRRHESVPIRIRPCALALCPSAASNTPMLATFGPDWTPQPGQLSGASCTSA
jgi:hypothetical protein